MFIVWFVGLQVVLFFLMTFHDWVHLPPLIDIRELEKHSTFKGRLINSVIFAFFVLTPLGLTVYGGPSYSFWTAFSILNFYGLLTLGTIFSWWVPYFFGSSDAHKEAFVEYKVTHHFLPERGDNVVPNTFHVIMHLVIWACFVLSGYLFFNFVA